MSLDTLRFDNRFVRDLPGDPQQGPGVRQVEGAAYSLIEPTPVPAPRLVAYSAEMAETLGLTPADLASAEFADLFGGNALREDMQPWAANYGGHQFGVWAGQLGDGRAISLGEALTAAGGRWELQLKGAGPTPYSRGADGRAVLRSSIREFVCSEAMHHLGVPTTRALCLVATGEPVVRDMFYDGHPRAEPGAIVCRVAPSFIRFGQFELPTSRGDVALLRQLADFTLARDFPHLAGRGEARYADWFDEVCARTASLMAHWMRVGFVHGVMNTDNMSILGLTLDYGPYGWIDDYDPEWTPNTTDAQRRRYRYGQQPNVAWWNLSCLAGALAPLFGDVAPLRASLERYAELYAGHERANAVAKLGLGVEREGDLALMQSLQEAMQQASLDMTLTFRTLGEMDVQTATPETFRELAYDEACFRAAAPGLADWLRRYAARLAGDPRPAGERRRAMHAVNPLYVPRNYLAQQAIDRAEQGDYAGVHELLDVLRDPYGEQPGREAYARKRPEWAVRKAGCSMLSCSS
ncbi:protein adenylyltransferase SelO [Frateuria defendens]|uniref:protein adenylyltransferase SelO n=1 Tax=Frateuria defendens TaxID=2219559 RepID=UPI00066FDE92|nr:YdiU family protein [Frateuria defendens]